MHIARTHRLVLISHARPPAGPIAYTVHFLARRRAHIIVRVRTRDALPCLRRGPDLRFPRLFSDLNTSAGSRTRPRRMRMARPSPTASFRKRSVSTLFAVRVCPVFKHRSRQTPPLRVVDGLRERISRTRRNRNHFGLA